MLMVVPCCCGAATCSTTINGKIIGCTSLGLPSISVEAHDATAGGTLIATTTTDASGNYTFSGISGVSGNNIVIVPVPGSRFVAVNRTLTWTSASTVTSAQWGCNKTTGTANTTQTPASGYHCGFGCVYPVADTLNGTDSWFGSFTLVNSGSGWVMSPASFNYTYAGCFGCPAKTVTITYGSFEWHWTAQPSGCPDNVGANPCNTVFSGTTTCYIPGTSAFSVNGTWPAGSPSSLCIMDMFCNNTGTPPSQTFTLTE